MDAEGATVVVMSVLLYRIVTSAATVETVLAEPEPERASLVLLALARGP